MFGVRLIAPHRPQQALAHVCSVVHKTHRSANQRQRREKATLFRAEGCMYVGPSHIGEQMLLLWHIYITERSVRPATAAAAPV